MTSAGAQAEPRPPGLFVGRDRELVEFRAGLSDVTAGHSHLFPLSDDRFLIIFARLSRNLCACRSSDPLPRQILFHGIGVVIQA